MPLSLNAHTSICGYRVVYWYTWIARPLNLTILISVLVDFYILHDSVNAQSAKGLLFLCRGKVWIRQLPTDYIRVDISLKYYVSVYYACTKQYDIFTIFVASCDKYSSHKMTTQKTNVFRYTAIVRTKWLRCPQRTDQSIANKTHPDIAMISVFEGKGDSAICQENETLCGHPSIWWDEGSVWALIYIT